MREEDQRAGFGERFGRALDQIDAANARDPNHELVNGQPAPKELVYSLRLTRWLLRLEPEASEALRLAARAQHIRRWEIPRERYAKTRKGYHQWRRVLYLFHGERTEEILREAGYGDEWVGHVRALVMKENLGRDAEMQTLEDAICLTFLEHYAADFAAKTPAEKLPTILARTWDKMSERARGIARELELSFDLPKDKME